MSVVKSLSVGDGDMFYIKHGGDNFTIIDCCLSDWNRKGLVDELKDVSSSKGVKRFISTHPDDDHFRGIEYLDQRMPISNFYCVANEATKPDRTDSFDRYCKLRDDDNAFFVSKDCKRKWINESDAERHHAGLHILWPDTSNADYKCELAKAKTGERFNNISLILEYYAANSARFLWLGDLETDFMEKITPYVSLRHFPIVFAPHHGRKTGKIPNSWLDRLKPKIIVIGEAPSRHLHYYTGYKTITQNQSGDITLDCCDTNKIHVYCSEKYYKADFLSNEGKSAFNYYKEHLTSADGYSGITV